MIVFDMTAKVLGTGKFSQLTIAYLISGITLIVLLSQEKPLPLKEINAQIQTDTKIYTQTEIHIYIYIHSHIHTRMYQKSQETRHTNTKNYVP